MEPKNSLRKSMGVSQEVFARMLGVSRSVLAMYETGKRPLPTNALIRYGQFRPPAPQPPSPAMNAISEQTKEKHLEDLRRKLERYSHLLDQSHKKLLFLRQEEFRASEALQLIEGEKSVFAGVGAYHDDLGKAHQEAWEAWSRANPGRQMMIEHRIAELTALITVTRTALESLHLQSEQ